ncbi:MAG: hypothetical protein ACREDY_08260, partial [Bradyrhizobium sp.]
AFDADNTAALSAAYEKAIGMQHGLPEVVREMIAKRIIAIGAMGERDPDRLCEAALTALGFTE